MIVERKPRPADQIFPRPLGLVSLDLDTGLGTINLFSGGTQDYQFTDHEKSSAARWLKGELLIQDAFPHYTPAERELFLSGMTDDEFPHDEENE